MGWKFYDANGVESIAQLGTVAIIAGGTGAITAGAALTALGGITTGDSPSFAAITATGVYSGGGLMTTGGNIVIPNAGNIGSVGDTNAITISSGGVIAITATTASTSATTGALTVAGGAGVALDLSVGDDILLPSVGGVINFNGGNMTITHSNNVLTVAGGAFAVAAFTATGVTTLNTVAYTWPSSDGASGASLQTNASGTLAWTVAAAGVGLGLVIALGG